MIKYNSKTIIKAYQNGNLINKIDKVVSGSTTAVTSESKTIFQYVTDGTEPTPPSFNGKYKFTLTDDSVVSGECDASSAITTAETSAYKTTLKEAVIGDCNTSIGNGGFQNCSGLTNIVIPDSVELIDGFAFFRCYSLSSATLGSGVTTIGDDAFANCTSLTSINIPDSVTTIGVDAFYGCTSLPVENNVRYADTYIVGITDRTLTTYTLKNTTRFISEGVFNECYSLENIVIPDSVTSIGYWAFRNCYSLSSATLGSGVTSIGNEAFYGCSGLTSITVNATTPPALGDYALGSTNGCPIYVPAESVSTYQTTSGWSDLSSRIQAIP